MLLAKERRKAKTAELGDIMYAIIKWSNGKYDYAVDNGDLYGKVAQAAKSGLVLHKGRNEKEVFTWLAQHFRQNGFSISAEAEAMLIFLVKMKIAHYRNGRLAKWRGSIGGLGELEDLGFAQAQPEYGRHNYTYRVTIIGEAYLASKKP